MKKNLSKEQQMGREMKENHDKNYYPPLVAAHANVDKSVYVTDVNYFTYRLRDVFRLATIPLIRKYSVAEHSYFTGLLFMDVCQYYGIVLSQDQIEWVFRHDLLEAVTGDLIYPVKHHDKDTEIAWDLIEKNIASTNELQRYGDNESSIRFTAIEWNIFKAVDLYELFLFTISEYKSGNRNGELLQVISNCIEYIPTFKIPILSNRVLNWAEENYWKLT